MSTLKPKDWIFLIPCLKEDVCLLYAPLHGLVTRVSLETQPQLKDLVEAASLDKNLEGFATNSMKFFSENALLYLPKSWSKYIRPIPAEHGITLSLTNDCNLRCIYCYAATGMDTTTLSLNTAKKAIYHGLHIAKSRNRNRFTLTFHGGGEALTRKRLFKACVLYALKEAKELEITLQLSLVTNATLITNEFARWMKDHNVNNITVSLDGTETTQNLQRPAIGGKGSFKATLEGMKNLINNELNFSIRATVTNLSVTKMSELVQFISADCFKKHCNLVHFEPISLCGRALNSKGLGINPEEYTKYYLEARALGRKIGVKVTCTLDTFKREKRYFCGAGSGTMFCVCPNDSVSACSRVTKTQDPGSELFFYGSFKKQEQVPILNSSKQRRIKKHGNLPKGNCSSCFARWNCQGLCSISRYLDKESFEQSCIIIRNILLQDILSEFQKKGECK